MTHRKLTPLGDRIAELQGDMTETELAERMELSRNQLYNIKRGISGTSTDTISRLVQAFSLISQRDIEELYHLAGFKAPHPPYAGEVSVAVPDIHALIEALTTDDREDLIQLAQTKWRRSHPGMSLPTRAVDKQQFAEFPRNWVLFDPDANLWYETNGQAITDSYRIRSLVSRSMQRLTAENAGELLDKTVQVEKALQADKA